MGKASRGKRQKELQAKSTLKDKPLKIEGTSSKWSLFHKLPLHFLLIAIIGFLAYSNTFNVTFHFDDTPNIVENYKLRDLNNFWPPSGSRWFGFLTFALNYHLEGLNRVGYHIVNLTIHILNAILVYFLVVLTFRTPYFKVSVISASVSNQPNQFNLSTFQPFNYLPLFIALLFVSHPIQTQAVTYIVQRFTSLATFFYLLSLVMYIKFRSQQSAISGQQKLHATRYTLYAVSFFSAILAMKTKEIAFTLPFIIILYEFCFFKSQNYELRTMNLRRLLYLMPFLLTLFIIPLSLIGIDKPIGDAIGELREAAQETEEIPRWSYLFTQFRVIVTYIRLLFLPINQNLDYDYPIYNSFFKPNVFLSFLFLLLVSGIGFYLLYRSRISHPKPKAKGLRDSSATPQTCPERDNEILPLNQVQGQNDRKRRNDINIPTRYTLHAIRLTAFGIFWFFITLSIESSIIPIKDVIFEHRLYLPSIGLITAFSAVIFYFISRLTSHASRFYVTTAYSLLTTVVIVFSIATYQRNVVWQDKISLWEDVVSKSPNKARGYISLGSAYYLNRWTDRAIEHYQTALKIKPDCPEAYYSLGNAYYYVKGWTDMAIEHYQIALRIKPDYGEAHYSLGNAYYDKGWIDMAIEHYQIALRIKPDYGEAYNNLGNAYQKKGLSDIALKYYQIALQLNPNHSGIYYNLGILFKDKGLLDKAIEHFQIALRLTPGYTEVYSNLGLVYESKGMLDEAIKQYQIALRLNPEDEVARNNLNRILRIKNK